MKAFIEIRLLSQSQERYHDLLHHEIQLIVKATAAEIIETSFSENFPGFTIYTVIESKEQKELAAALEEISHKITASLKKFLYTYTYDTSGEHTSLAISTAETNQGRIYSWIEKVESKKDNGNNSFALRPQKTYAILIGNGEFEDRQNFLPLPAVAGNLEELGETFTNSRLMGLPRENICYLLNESSQVIIQKLVEFSSQPDLETLIVYFAGHSALSSDHNFNLITRDAKIIGNQFYDTIEFSAIREIVDKSHAIKKVIILDTCSAGSLPNTALNKIEVAEKAVSNRAYILAYTGQAEVEWHKRDAPTSYFTGYIVQGLREGTGTEQPRVSLKDLYSYTRAMLGRDNLPGPVRQHDNSSIREDHFFISTNPAFDLAVFQRIPFDLLKQNRFEEAELAYHETVAQYPDDTRWIHKFQEERNTLIVGKLLHEADRLAAQHNYAAAQQKYIEAEKLGYSNNDLSLKIKECSRMFREDKPIRTLSQPSDKLMRQIEKLKEGYLQLKCSQRMTIGKKENVAIEIFRDSNLIDRKGKDITLDEIRVSTAMSVKLIGSDFNIIAKNSISQLILQHEKTVWEFEVKPLKYGMKKLEVVVTIKLLVNDRDEVYDYPILHKEVVVSIDRVYMLNRFFEKNWQWILSTIIGSGVLIVILRWMGIISK